MPRVAKTKTPTSEQRTDDADPRYTVQMIPLADLVPTADNPRFPAPMAAPIASLRESIDLHGILHPLVARPHPDHPGQFDLRAGNRRLQAARSLGMSHVPVIVYDMTDTEAMEVTVAENLERENLHPLEEARGIAQLAAAGWDMESLASRLGRSTRWVARRARLTHLIPTLAAWACDPRQDLYVAPTGVLELLAALPAETQEAIVSAVSDKAGALDGRVQWGSLRDVRDFVGEFVSLLASAPWNLDDVTLHPQAGSCADCRKRSSCEPLLFDEEDFGGRAAAKVSMERCLDLECFQAKRRRFLLNAVQKTLSQNPKAVVVGWPNEVAKLKSAAGGREEAAALAGLKCLQTYDVVEVKKSTPGAVPAVYLTGDKPGRTKWVITQKERLRRERTKQDGGTADDELADPRASKRARLNERRMAMVVEMAQSRIAAALQSTEGVSDLLRETDINGESVGIAHAATLLLSIFLPPNHVDLANRFPEPRDAFESLDKLVGMDAETLMWKSYRLVVQEWLDRFLNTTHQVEDRLGRLHQMAGYLRLNIEEMTAEAEQAIPTPKSLLTECDA